MSTNESQVREVPLGLKFQEKCRQLPLRPLSYEERVIISEIFPIQGYLDDYKSSVLPKDVADVINRSAAIQLANDPPRPFFSRFKVFYDLRGSGVVVGSHTPDLSKNYQTETYLVAGWGKTEGGVISELQTALSAIRDRLAHQAQSLSRTCSEIEAISTNLHAHFSRAIEILRTVGESHI